VGRSSEGSLEATTAAKEESDQTAGPRGPKDRETAAPILKRVAKVACNRWLARKQQQSHWKAAAVTSADNVATTQHRSVRA